MNRIAIFLSIGACFLFEAAYGADHQAIVNELIADVSGNDTNTTTTTTTTHAPVTTPAPTAGHWHFNYSDGRGDHFCILFDASSVEIQITYPTQNGSHRSFAFAIPADATVARILSKCGPNLTNEELNEILALNMTAVLVHSSLPVHLEFYFTRDPSITGDKTLARTQLYNITAGYTYTNASFPGIDPSLIGKDGRSHANSTLHEFAVSKDRSYQCSSSSKIHVDEKLAITFAGLRVQAFLANDHFSAPEPCPADAHTSDLVPIIIGAVLAAIVLVVLIAYLIGRARMRRTTYESI